MSTCNCPDCTERYLERMELDDRRVKAAVAATKDFTVEGLEQIAASGLTLELALKATFMLGASGLKRLSEKVSIDRKDVAR